MITPAPRRFRGGPLRVLVGKERFSENHAWSEMPRYWPAGLADRVAIEVAGQGQLEARLADGGPPVDVVVPLFSELPGQAIRTGSFGLIQQFGVGVDNIDVDAAAEAGVWVANMPGLNAVPVAEHAVTLLLALARRLSEAQKGFEPGRWGEPAGRSLTGTAACIVGAGAVGTQIARRLAAFDVTVTGLRRHSYQREAHTRDGQRGERGAGQIEAAGMGRVPGLWHMAERGHDDKRPERKIDQEDRAPRHRVGQVPADGGANRARDRTQTGPRTDRPAAIIGMKDRLDDRKAPRSKESTPDPLNEPGGHEQSDRRGGRAQRRRGHEDHHSQDEYATPAVDIAERTTHQANAASVST